MHLSAARLPPATRRALSVAALLVAVLVVSGCRSSQAVNQSYAASQVIRDSDRQVGYDGRLESGSHRQTAEADAEARRAEFRQALDARQREEEEVPFWWDKLGVRAYLGIGYSTRL